MKEPAQRIFSQVQAKDGIRHWANRVRTSRRAAGLWNLSRMVLQQTPRPSESRKSLIAGVIVSELLWGGPAPPSLSILTLSTK
ncbi:hypothetical protein NKI72_33325 [Mesorhizobium sp. M0437]|uniref:hypothetical protein n=1 Tax=Mesorhizobium sp. M0437 TaxID=2956945 RepID=UPI00333C6D1F